MRTALVTGGAGFIGSHLVRSLVADGWRVVNLDALTYAADPRSMGDAWLHERHQFIRGCVTERAIVGQLLHAHTPEVVYHLAAESHVTAAIGNPALFLRTNVIGTVALLDELRALNSGQRPRLVHVSTDEVYGSLHDRQPPFTERNAFNPSGPYAASKAAADGYVTAYAKTYGLDVVVARPANNFGPAQHTEKLIPMVIAYAVRGEPFPMHGDGAGLRDWVRVQDCARALRTLAENGKSGEAYGVSAGESRSPRQVVNAVHALLKRRGVHPRGFEHVAERAANDRRYATDWTKLERLGWSPVDTFEKELANTVDWYLENRWALERRAAKSEAETA